MSEPLRAVTGDVCPAAGPTCVGGLAFTAWVFEQLGRGLPLSPAPLILLGGIVSRDDQCGVGSGFLRWELSSPGLGSQVVTETLRQSPHPFFPQMKTLGPGRENTGKDTALDLLLGRGGSAQGFFLLC